MATPTETTQPPARTPAPGRPDDRDDLVELVIRPRTGWIAVDWNELYRYRELLFFLVWRDVKVRYKQTVMGVAWAVLQPLMSLIIFTVIFGRFAGIPSEGVPYPVFVFAGLLPWMFFSAAISQAGQSLVTQSQLITKVYFPRLFVPTAAAGALMVDFAITFGLYAAVLALYGVVPSWQIVFLPGLIALTLLATFGVGYLLASVTVFYRDFRFVVPFLVQILMYASPVIYPTSMLPAGYRWALALNPMAGIIEGYRSSILGLPWKFDTLAISTVAAVGLFVLGVYYFRKVERWFADIA
ncbi:MAG: ABC transporter permease [Isosphaeraceae bacterium]